MIDLINELWTQDENIGDIFKREKIFDIREVLNRYKWIVTALFDDIANENEIAKSKQERTK